MKNLYSILFEWVTPRGIIAFVNKGMEEQCRAIIDRFADENTRMKEALTKLKDCDFGISLPDRMDAVRKIAGEALEPTK